MGKRKRYTVELTGTAYVRQRRNVIAESQEAAVQKALETYNDHTWDYQGIKDETVKVNARFTGDST
jgi:hypothetical protein